MGRDTKVLFLVLGLLIILSVFSNSFTGNAAADNRYRGERECDVLKDGSMYLRLNGAIVKSGKDDCETPRDIRDYYCGINLRGDLDLMNRKLHCRGEREYCDKGKCVTKKEYLGTSSYY